MQGALNREDDMVLFEAPQLACELAKSVERRSYGQLHDFAGESLEMWRGRQGTVNARGRDFKVLEANASGDKRILQQVGNLDAVFNGD